MTVQNVLIATLLFCFTIPLTSAQTTNWPNSKAKAMIESFVADFRNDRYAAEPRTIGLEVPRHGSWTVEVTGTKTEDGWGVLIREGPPETATYVYTIEYGTLEAIHQGKINSLTAQGKAFSSDYTPMSVREMEGFTPTEADDGKLNAFSFHFWTRGFPEIVPFNPNTTRKAHGANFSLFYYEKGLRTGWSRVMPNDKVRHDPREQALPFPMMVVAIKGTTEGDVDGTRVTLSEGNMLFIPPGANHKWWNETSEPSEAILIMFGEGA